jgi:quercetin dioxygenase-like cupin family protein
MPARGSLRATAPRYCGMTKPLRYVTGISLVAAAVLPSLRAGAGSDALTVAAPATVVLNVTTGALPKTPTAAVQVRSAALAPGSATPWHTHPSPPFVYVVSGSGTWEYRGAASQAKHAGEAIVEPVNLPMRVVNRGSVPLRLVIFQVSQPGAPTIVPAR